MLIPALLAGTVFLATFAASFLRELKRTPWDLLETLVLFTIVGHVIALPLAWAIQDVGDRKRDEWIIYAAGLAGFVYACFMTGGAVWVFRRLNRLDEQRRKVRLIYLLLGLLLFPTMTTPLFLFTFKKYSGFILLGMLLSLPVWVTLWKLNLDTGHLPDPAEDKKVRERWRRRQDILRQRQEREKTLSENDGAA